jgi:glycosyltransferase involved in cell wall biosynthesis
MGIQGDLLASKSEDVCLAAIGQNGHCPRVSIGLPVFNGERYLQAALDSICGQSFTDFELIISDNASTDGTESIASAYAARDHRIHYSRQTHNRGGAWNFNHVFALSRGEYFKWASHDDVLAPTFLERGVEALDRSPSAVLAYPRTIKINDRGEEVVRVKIQPATDSRRAWRRFHDLLHVPHGCYQGSGLIRRSILADTPLIDTYVESDRVLIARLGLLGTFYEVPEYLFYSRSHAEQSIRLGRHQRIGWFDPSRRGRIAFPVWRVYREYLRCVREVPLTSHDRVWCYLTLLQWPLWNGNWLWLAGDLRRAALALLGR